MSKRLTFEQMRDLEQRTAHVERLTVRQQLIESGAIKPAADGPTPTSTAPTIRMDDAARTAAQRQIAHGRRFQRDAVSGVVNADVDEALRLRRGAARRRRL